MNKEKIKELLDNIEYEADNATHSLGEPEKIKTAIQAILTDCEAIQAELGGIASASTSEAEAEKA